MLKQAAHMQCTTALPVKWSVKLKHMAWIEQQHTNSQDHYIDKVLRNAEMGVACNGIMFILNL